MRAIAIIIFAVACTPQHRFDDYVAPNQDGPAPPDVGPGGRTMVSIPPGVSIQGGRVGALQDPPIFDGEPVHQVYTSGYDITRGCVDQAWYDECVGSRSCTEDTVTMLSRDRAAAFCAWLGMRLPTEAELERAMRGDAGAEQLGAYELAPCGFGEAGVWTSDNYRCDAYVDRAWANPQELSGDPHARRFADFLGIRSLPSTVKGVRCVQQTETSPAPPPPERPACTGACNVVSLALGDRFGCVARGDGSVWCWGSNEHGELATRDHLDAMPATMARRSPAFDGATTIAAGDRFACALVPANNAAVCWGANELGQIAEATGLESEPVVVANNVTAVAAAGAHGCAIQIGGAVLCWGRGSAIPGGAGPTTVTPTGITGATAIAAGPVSDCAITANDVRCWGTLHDASGTAMHVPPTSPRILALAGATQIAVGGGHGCAVVGTTVSCWGARAQFLAGGSGIAVTPEVLPGAFVAPRVYAGFGGTIVVDQGAVVVSVNTRVPASTSGITGAIALSGPFGDACAPTATGVRCFGVERGALGRGNGCDANDTTSVLALP